MKPQYTKVFLEEKKDDRFTFVASDETTDRHGDSLPVEAWDLRFFRRAPRILADHDHRIEKIVGRAENVKIEKGTKRRLVIDVIFHQLTELSRVAHEMVVKGFLDTVSVGYIPHAPKEGEKIGRNELVEVSLVTVPANPNAQQIKTLLEKDEDEECVEGIREWLGEKVTGEITVKQMEIQTLIFSKKKFSTASEAKKWAKEHDFKSDKVDETDTSYRLRQFNPDLCTEGSPRTIKLDDGIKAVTCKREGKSCKVDEPEKTVDKTEKKDEPTKTKIETAPRKRQIPRKSPSGTTQKGRSLSRADRQALVLRGAAKEAAKIINFALNQDNQLRKDE